MRIVAQNARYDRKQGFLAPSRQNFEDIGSLTFDELSNLRHRGAFSTVSQTFTACCQLVQRIPAHQRDANLVKKWYEVSRFRSLDYVSLISDLHRGHSIVYTLKARRLEGQRGYLLSSLGYWQLELMTHLFKMLLLNYKK